MSARSTVALIHSPLTTAAAWGDLGGALSELGWPVVITESFDDGPPYLSRFVAYTSQQLQQLTDARQLVLVGHGEAGPLLPQIAFARRAAGLTVQGYVFVDALLPRTLRTATLLDVMESADTVATAEIAQHLSHGDRFPDLTDRGLISTLPDAGQRALLLASLQPRPLDFFTESLPLPEDWPDAPCGYARLSESYTPEAGVAELRGWPVESIESHHFAALTHPRQVAHVIDQLLRD
jgi:hypothetical protein